VENLFKIAQMYREMGKNLLAYQFFRMAAMYSGNASLPKHFLFLERDVYDFKLDYELTIIGYYCNLDQYDLPKVCVQVMSHPGLEEWMAQNILSNYKFYAPNSWKWGSLPDVLDDAVDIISTPRSNRATPPSSFTVTPPSSMCGT
jgi:hypothetical protein